MTAAELWQEFQKHYDRDDRALALRGQRIVGFGGGATGSFTEAQLAHTGCDLVIVDRDLLDEANLMRHYLTDRRLVGQPKAHALARRLRAELPALQTIKGVKGNIEALTDAELRVLLDGAVLVLGCTGRDPVDRRLNRITRELGIPFVVPSLWGGDQNQVLGDLQIVAWNLPNRRGGCFECLRPARETEAPPAEAQRGLGAEVQRVATLTTEAVLGLLLPDSPQHAPLMRQLNRGANYFLIPRWPPSLRAVITRPRRGCEACSTGSPQVAAMSGPTTDAATMRDWAIGLSLASAVVWHQLVPGLDAVATIGLVTAAGLWWRGRLPSFQQTAAWIRRNFSH